MASRVRYASGSPELISWARDLRWHHPNTNICIASGASPVKLDLSNPSVNGSRSYPSLDKGSKMADCVLAAHLAFRYYALGDISPVNIIALCVVVGFSNQPRYLGQVKVGRAGTIGAA